MKKFLVPLAIILVLAFLIAGCGKSSTTTTAPVTVTTSAPAVTTTTTAPASTVTTTKAGTTTTAPASTVTTTKPAVTSTTTVPAAAAPVSGGIYRIIAPSGPQVLGGFAGGPADAGAVFPMIERLMDATKDRSMGNGLEPVLAQSVDDDVANKKIVFHLRPGVKFHDGSDLNADVVVWMFQRTIDAGRLQYANYFTGIKKLDNMTVEIDYNKYTNQLIQSWGWTAIYSMKSYVDANGTDAVKGAEWDKTHCVGTGPFILKEFKKDDHMTMIKNPNYWRAGQPYMDGIEVRYIPDPMTAQNIFLAGQADEWSGAPIKNQADLVKQGFVRVSNWAAMPVSVWPNTADPASPWNNIKLRYALEYALDKGALAKALGFGFYTPMYMLAAPGEWGYDPNYPNARMYNPSKAKQLLSDAGFPNGLKTKLLVANDQSAQDAGTAVKGYLDAVGINTDLDVADPGRFYGAVWGNNPNPGLSIMWSGKDVTNLVTYMRWFSTDPFTNLAYLGHTAEQQRLDEIAKGAASAADQKAATINIVNYMSDNAFIVPLYDTPSAIMVQKYVHNDRFSQGFIRWQSENTWMEKH